MIVLKFVCDQFNWFGEVNLMLVMLGFDCDKLMWLVNIVGVLFYGLQVQCMLLLGIDFIVYVVVLIEVQCVELIFVDWVVLQQVFDVFGYWL